MSMLWGTRECISISLAHHRKIALARHDRRYLSNISVINSIWNCTTMQFDALLPLIFFWTINNLIRILWSKVTFSNEISYRNVFSLLHILHWLKGILFQCWLNPRSFSQLFKVKNQSPNRHVWYSLLTQFALLLKMEPSRQNARSIFYSYIQPWTSKFKGFRFRTFRFLFTVLVALFSLRRL